MCMSVLFRFLKAKSNKIIEMMLYCLKPLCKQIRFPMEIALNNVLNRLKRIVSNSDVNNTGQKCLRINCTEKQLHLPSRDQSASCIQLVYYNFNHK